MHARLLDLAVREVKLDADFCKGFKVQSAFGASQHLQPSGRAEVFQVRPGASLLNGAKHLPLRSMRARRKTQDVRFARVVVDMCDVREPKSVVFPETHRRGVPGLGVNQDDVGDHLSRSRETLGVQV